ncbi:MAG: hypothetical protein P4M13_00540 [Alphaproteobacteria bacterium]|nr:hypothetical protein [Alphaproteobacteria bacterium]
MLFAHPQGGGTMRWVATSFNLKRFSRHIDFRVLYDVVVVSGALLIGALLWLALASPLPTSPNRAFEPRDCSLMEHAGNRCAPMLPSH